MKAWQFAMELLKEVYELCKQLPPSERFNLVDQIKRATLSISNNIAEGAARRSPLERRRFYEVARSSAVEVDNCLAAAVKLGLLDELQLAKANEINESIFRLLSKMMDSSGKMALGGIIILIATLSGILALI